MGDKPKAIEYKKGSAQSALVVEISKDQNGVWNIEPADAIKANMKQRAAYDLTAASSPSGKDISDEWRARRAGGAPPLPHFKMDAGHTPWIIREGEDIEFVCTEGFAFSVWVDRDPNVSVVASAPGNPFGWQLPQVAAPGAKIQGTVRGKGANNIGPADQRFYKVVAWVFDEHAGQTVTVDPDGICDR